MAITADILTDEQAAQILSDLGGRDQEAGSRALAAVLEAQDTRFISVLLEILRGTEIGMSLGIDYPTTVTALEKLSGQSLGANWPAGSNGMEAPISSRRPGSPEGKAGC